MNPIVQTEFGAICGKEDGNVLRFPGIPYAAAPVGELRFLPPQDPAPWTDTLDCTHYRSAAPQVSAENFKAGFADGEDVSEDCLFLNVHVPKEDTPKKPVVFYVHGGAYQKNSASTLGDASVFTEQGIIAVACNFRLGVLGFFDFSKFLGNKYIQSGNSGLLDVVKALEWVKKNIAAFGGDPDNVTVLGQSSGGKMVSTLSVMPAAKGLYNKLIIHSGGLHTMRTRETAAQISERFLEAAGIAPNEAEKLFTMPWQDLIAAQKSLLAGLNLHSCGPVVDGITITSADWRETIRTGKANPGTLLIGTNRDELMLYWFVYKFQSLDAPMAERLFGKYANMVLADYAHLDHDDPNYAMNFVHFMTEYVYRNGAVAMAEEFHAAGNTVYCWQNNWDKRALKACHVSTLFMLLRNHKAYPENTDTEDYRNLETAVGQAWCSFIKTGVPAAQGMPAWPAFTAEGREMMNLDSVCTVGTMNPSQVCPNWPDNVFEL